ncbi:MAG: aldo/keto reductase [Myxococcota bacterium]|jgi:aryl-alcohol dehydrogenase-like predicted oxidoreductase
MATLGLGLAALGRPGYMTLGHACDLPSTEVGAMAAHAARVLDAAYDAGVRHFDTARSYGRGEDFLRAWLDARRPDGVTVSSKWGYRYTAGWRTDAEVHEVKDHSLAHLEAQWPESKARLAPWLKVYQIHSATLESGVLADGAVLERLARLRDEEGVAIGLSVTGPRQADVVDTARVVTRGGRRLFDWVQATWNVLEPSAGPALARAAADGLKVIVKEGLANGRLTERGDVPEFLALARARGVTPDALALAAALAQPWATIVLSGATTVAQLASNLRAQALTVAPGEFDAFARAPDTYWRERATLRWT